MTSHACEREQDLLEALGRGFVTGELESHVAACTACHELRRIAEALLDERAVAVAEASVPAAGTMWWRMRIRRRQEAMARARRTLRVGQGLTLSAVLGLLLSLFGSEITGSLRTMVASLGFTLGPTLGQERGLSLAWLAALATLALLIPIASWLALRRT